MDEQEFPADDLEAHRIQGDSDGALQATREATAESQAMHDVMARQVTLRDERSGSDSRHLFAYTDAKGCLHIDGQDLGPGTGGMSSDGEYEWFETFAAEDVPRVVALLDGQPDEDVLDVLERWSGQSDELTRRLRESGIPSAVFAC